MKKNSGMVVTISTVFIAISMVIFTLVITVFISHVNSVLYNFKIEMYTLNRSAIIAVNKNKANVDNFSYDTKTYEREFVKLLKNNYELNDDLKNENKLISKIEIKEYKIYEARAKDSYTNKNVQTRTIHTISEVKIRPIILKSILEKVFVFTIHEDVALNMLET